MSRPEKPNILLLFPDQLRADYLGCYGADFARTPNIDRLCSESVKYSHCFSPSPLCVPARASMLTGRNAIRTGVFHNDHWLRPDHARCGMPTWPERLARNGYWTEAIGKMHFYPWDISEGFLHRSIAEDKRHYLVRDDYWHYLRAHGLEKYHAKENPGYFEHKGAAPSRIPFEHQVDIWCADRAVEFLESYDSDQPFACMVGFPGPHCPYDPPQDIAEQFDPEDMPDSIPENEITDQFRDAFLAGMRLDWNGVDYREFSEPQRKRIKAYYSALIHQIDIGVGRILDALERTGRIENTVVIFAADHGEYAGDYGFVGKSHFMRPSIHVPLFIRMPDFAEPRTVDSVVSLTDLCSTILRISETPFSESDDSKVLPGLPGYDGTERDYLFAASSLGYMVVREPWKYTRYYSGTKALHNLEDDPDDRTNRLDDPACRGVIEELSEIMNREIDASIMDANDEKIVERGGLCGEGAFGERGWQRTYPADPKDFVPHHLVEIE
ncbi:sulfatase [Kiritimatiella glycovorans]|uniref:Arylsulfatase n=1 Tax=Kiritimatiella glycovorans TaxID=1307763 RepID=A0A0G3EKA7_9BACT|nr:sulfatase-like hydrolase/transferase [Kiritimatiella glycovorans]AKJ64604.1 Arylsulfatase [Kiritimatiella glycovorans]